LTVLAGRQIAQRGVWALLVVIDHPPMRCFAYVFEAGEEVLIEDFFAEGSIESLDVRVLVRLAWLDVSQGHAVSLEPLNEALAQELRAVV
jgi:hypothetical protein